MITGLTGRTYEEKLVELNTVTVDSIIQEAGDFITQVTRLYNENEGYAPGLTGLEKSLTEIKPFSAGSDVTVFEFIDKFNAYCLGTKKAKAYKLYHNYLSISIQAQTESFNHNFYEMINFLRSTYGKIEVVSANLLAELERRKKPRDNELPAHADSLLAIMNVILRIQNLRTHLPEEQVMAEISSYSFLHRIRNLL